nr:MULTISPECIES: hypothetical protein [unclassified Janthinobacterium]
MLQPALVDVLQQRIGGQVGGGHDLDAIETDDDAVERLAGHDGIGHARLEVGELGPSVQLGIRQVRVEVGLLAAVFGAVHGGQVARFAFLGLGVGAAGNRAGHAQAQLFAFLFAHADDVDFRQELARFLHFRFQLLLHAGRYAEGLGDAIRVVQLAQAGFILAVDLAGVLFHLCLLRD